MLIVLSEFKSATILYSSIRTKLIARITSCTFINKSPLISPLIFDSLIDIEKLASILSMPL